MKAPVLSRPVLLEAPVRSPDGAGGFTAGWAVLGTLWAEIVPGSGGEQGAAGVSLSRVIHRVTVRGAPVGAEGRPKAEQRFRDGTRLLRILSVTERDPDGRWLICQTEEEVAR
jgi:head-tail adaptor